MSSLPQVRQMDVIAPSLAAAALIGAFNTFREGSKWADLKDGEPLDIAVRTAPGEEPLAIVPATVFTTDHGRMAQMIVKYGWSNHAVKAHDELDKPLKFWLRDLLQGIYPDSDDYTPFTVVSLTVDPRFYEERADA